MGFRIGKNGSADAWVHVPRCARGRDGDTYDVLPEGASDVQVRLASISPREVASLRRTVELEVGGAELRDVRVEVLERPNPQNEGKERPVVEIRHERVPHVSPEAVGIELMIRVYLRVLVGWRGVEAADGTALPLTRETALTVADEAPGLLRWVVETATGRAAASAAEEARELDADLAFRSGGDEALAVPPGDA